MRTASTLTLLLLLSLLGCPGDDGGGGSGGTDTSTSGGGGGGMAIGSCDVPQAFSCVDYVGSMWTSASAEDNCNQIPNSTYADTPCSTMGVVGSCITDGDNPGEFITHYYDATIATAGEMICNDGGGTWVP